MFAKYLGLSFFQCIAKQRRVETPEPENPIAEKKRSYNAHDSGMVRPDKDRKDGTTAVMIETKSDDGDLKG
jgi:hypothetical protein